MSRIFFLCFREALGLHNGGGVLCEKYYVKECLWVKIRELCDSLLSVKTAIENMQKLGKRAQTSLFETIDEALRDG